jgi:hypothetical protein
VAAGHSATALIDQISGQLTRLLSLRSCRLQSGVAGLGKPARLRPDGQVTVADRVQDFERDGQPPSTELLVENHGVFHGRFLMAADPQSRSTLEQRLVAVAFADQAWPGARRKPTHRPITAPLMQFQPWPTEPA